MLDLQFICDNPELVEKNCQSRGVECNIPRIVELRQQRSALITAGDEIRRQQKETAGKIPKATAEERPALIEGGKQLKIAVAANEANLKDVEAELFEEQSKLPNMTHPDAPLGGEEDAKQLRTWGEPAKFDFTPKDHVELMADLDLVDFEAGAKVAGSGFYFLKNEAVLLELALIQFAVEKVRSEGFTLHTTPDLARQEILQGTGYQPRGPETQIYSIENTDLSLIATAEIPLGGMLRDQILDEADLPLKAAGLSHCFRTEAGGHGKASKGIYRVHQFTKVEMFGFTAPDLAKSDEIHQLIVRIEEEIFQALEIPYQVVDTAAGDLGGPAYRKFDLEAWMPGRGEGGEYGEVTSASNCTDFQSRRLGIRCKSANQKGTQFVHTLNGTAIAITRAMIALIENHQQADGSIRIPEALQKWMGMDKIAKR
ncbi:serine--tRNA ligase [Thalassoglobus polymorphus]|uniref:Serine--tRNA ligase n=1 Tax=Thalassoglobus polymorphus TaxID=2527994 RepID=A0A517QI33_9PLAN|nr:serine--tRNA ligase [Thalassoglobus polymorphus]QDT31254.1 Serine--tRNA ligase [Thalassoglobus polymorphus]